MFHTVSSQLTQTYFSNLSLQGDVSNRQQKSNNDRKPAAKRSTVSSMVVEGVAKLRRSARSNTDSGESKDAEPKKRLSRKQSRDEGEPVEAKQRAGSKKRRSARKQQDEEEETEAEAQRATRTTRRSGGAKESDETKPASKGKRSARSAPAEDDVKEPAAKRVKRSNSAKAKKSSKTAKPKAKASTKATTVKRRARSKVAKEPVKPLSEKRVLCSDFVTDSNFTLVRVPFDPAKYTAGIAKHDEHNKDDPLEAAAYVTDLFQRLYHSEVRVPRLIDANFVFFKRVD
jgi:hypothetical protein